MEKTNDQKIVEMVQYALKHNVLTDAELSNEEVLAFILKVAERVKEAAYQEGVNEGLKTCGKAHEDGIKEGIELGKHEGYQEGRREVLEMISNTVNGKAVKNGLMGNLITEEDEKNTTEA